MGRKLTKRQKAKNKSAYKAIRKEYDKVKDNAPITYMQFKHRVVNRAKGDGISIKEAAKKEARTKTFLSAAERSRENILSGIKESHRGAYEELRNLAREKGRYKKLSESLVWDRDRNGYILQGDGKTYFIDVTNSPEEVNIREIG